LEDDSYEFQINSDIFTDIDLNDQLTYTTTLDGNVNLPQWFNFNSTTLNYNCLPTNDVVGIHNISLIATDLAGEFVTIDFEINVINQNDAPVLNIAIPDFTTKVNEQFNFTLTNNSFIDIDLNDKLTYSAFQNENMLPTWLNFDPISLTFYGNSSQIGEYQITVKATDNQLAYATDIFTIFVTEANSINNLDNYKISIYPNPTNNKFVVNLPANSQSEISVIDVLGRTIKEFENVNSEKLEVDLSNFAKGVYNVQVKIGEQTFNEKLILH